LDDILCYYFGDADTPGFQEFMAVLVGRKEYVMMMVFLLF